MNLSYTEIGWVEECAKADATAVRKLLFIEQFCQDQELRRLCRELAESHRRHVEMIARSCGIY